MCVCVCVRARLRLAHPPIRLFAHPSGRPFVGRSVRPSARPFLSVYDAYVNAGFRYFICLRREVAEKRTSEFGFFLPPANQMATKLATTTMFYVGITG